jgi:peptidoglycan/xylan/chitin deacetylase (PgdA/CDA1 family)
LARLLHVAADEPKVANTVFPFVGAESPAASDPEGRRRRIREAVTRLKAKPIAEVLDTVATITHKIEASGIGEQALALGEDHFMTWAQVREMRASGLVTIGSHTQTHIPLTKQRVADARQELLASKVAVDAHTHSVCTTFAYPNGDFDDKTVDWVRSAGYVLAFTTVRGRVAKGADPLRLGRFNIHEAAARTAAYFLNGIVGPL